MTVTSAGMYTYDPTQASWLKSGLVVGPVTDTFTVTASNGIYTSVPGVINVPIIGTLPTTQTAPWFNATIITNHPVAVTNTASGNVAATVQVGTNPFAVAVSSNGKTAYVTNQADGTVSVIDAATDPVLAAIPDGSRIYVTNILTDTVSVLDIGA